MDTTWIYFVNFIEASTRNKRYAKILKIATHHRLALLNKAGDPFFDMLYNSFNPIYEIFRIAFILWFAQKGKQMSVTFGLKQQLKVLSKSKINEWDVAIQAIYPRDSASYKALLQHHHTPFQKGSQLSKVNAVNTLNLALTGIPALASVKADVDAFATILNDAFGLQKQSKSATTFDSMDVEDARIALSTAIFANYGAMINKFPSNPESCIKYFNEKLIRNTSQVVFTGHLKPGKLHVICRRTFAPTDILELRNDSNISLFIYVGYAKNSTVPEGAYELKGNTNISIMAEILGNLENNYLIIFNPDASVKAKWKVSIE